MSSIMKCMAGCGKHPSCNYRGESKRLYCKKCKLPGMIDVKNKQCEKAGCFKYPNYNYPGEKVRKFCKKCKTPGMINITYKKENNKVIKNVKNVNITYGIISPPQSPQHYPSSEKQQIQHHNIKDSPTI
eukprot:Pgem_evm1s10706